MVQKQSLGQFPNKEEVPKEALIQKHFNGHYCSDSQNCIEDWVITLIDSVGTLKE